MLRRIGVRPPSSRWMTTSGASRMLFTNQYHEVKTADGKTGYVVATEPMIEMVRAMDSKDARLLRGVPYCENIEAKRLLDEHCTDTPPERGRRYALVCNTGPTGVGKTMLQCQNMLQAAYKGYLAVYTDFNGEQVRSREELQLGFVARVALRIAWYCREDEDDPFKSANHFTDYSRLKVKNHMPDVEQMTVGGAVQKLKDHAGHKDAVLLAIDELKKSAENSPEAQRGVEVRENLTDVCTAMDQSIGKKVPLPPKEERIYLAVSVYDAVSLADMATESGRNLLLQPTPPVFPLWVVRGSVDEAAISNLPLAMRMFFDRTARDALYGAGMRRQDTDKACIPVRELILTLGDLVFATAGHGRRVEALVRELAKLTPTLEGDEKVSLREECDALAGHFRRPDKSVPQVPDVDCSRPTTGFVHWTSAVKGAMNDAFDLEDVVSELDDVAKQTKDPSQFFVHLLEGLFAHDKIATKERNSRGAHMRQASLGHYGLLGVRGERKWTIGYLPVKSISALCKHLEYHGKVTTAKHTALVEFVKEAAECAQLFAGSKVDLAKAFERAMMHTMCAAVLSGRQLNDMMRSGSEKPLDVSSQLTDIEVLDVKSFPRTTNGKKEVAAEKKLIKAITAVGTGRKGRTRGLAFVPTDIYNRCCDLVIVLPLQDGGRVVLLVQCKHWFPDKQKGGYAFDHFRWGQQFVQEEKVYRDRFTTTKTQNVAYAAMQKMRAAKGTEVRHVLLTVNAAPREYEDGPMMRNKTLSTEKKPWNVPTSSTPAIDYKDAVLRDDEWLMDLEHMRGWCPSVAYSALMGLQVRSLWADLPAAPLPEEGGG